MKICRESRRRGGTDSFLEECFRLRDVDSIRFPRLVEAFRENGQRCLVMDWIRGITLEERIMERGPLQAKEAVAVTCQLCEALQVLHQKTPPILHLDLKPSNIMLTEEGVRLIDFGSALSGWEGLHACSGTPGYASPEQTGMDRGQTEAAAEVDERSDIYSLGAVLFAMLTGEVPFCRGRRREIPPALGRIVRRAMHPDTEKRFQSVEELAEALRRLRGESRRRRARDMLKTGILAVLILFAACRGAELLTICYGFWEKGTLSGITLRQVAAGLSPTVLCCLWERGMSRLSGGKRPESGTGFRYRQEKNRLRTEKRGRVWTGICAGILAVALASGSADALYAQEKEPAPEEGQAAEEPVSAAGYDAQDTGSLPVVLRDEGMRKLLVREGCICETEGPLYLEIPWELLESGEILRFSMEGTDGEGPVRSYAFSCRRKQE